MFRRTTPAQTRGYIVDGAGLLEPVTLPIVDGVLCSHGGWPLGGWPLERTDQTTELKGWGFDLGRVYLSDNGRQYIVEEPLEVPTR